MRRVPIRARLTLAFAAAMAAVLAATGFLLFNHLAVSLDQSLDQGLHARAADVAALVQQADTGLRDAHSPPAADGGFAQILDRRGRIFDQTRDLSPRPLLAGRLLTRAPNGPVLIPRAPAPAGEVRLLALPVEAQASGSSSSSGRRCIHATRRSRVFAVSCSSAAHSRCSSPP